MPKLELLETAMGSLKRVRSSCLSFEDTLQRSLDEYSDGGVGITESEMILLETKLMHLAQQSQRATGHLRMALKSYRKKTGGSL